MDSKQLITKFLKILNGYYDRMNESEQYGDIILHTAEMHLIEIIGKNPDIKPSEIAGKMGISKGRVSQLTRTLTERKLIEQSFSDENRKEKYLNLTKTGKTAFIQHECRDKKLLNPIVTHLDSLSEKDKAVIDRLLELVIHQFKTN